MANTVSFKKTGQWQKAGVVLKHTSARLNPAFKAKLYENGDMILERIKGHIDAQDLPWTPLSQQTIQRKGHDTIYVETGFLRDNLEVRKVKSTTYGVTLFAGASAWKRTPKGVKLSDLMIWLEYGTSRIPPRPLIRPTFEEVEGLIKNEWVDLLKDIVEGRV